MRNKKAISPIISTVLLIMLVMILAAIIVLWYKGIFKTEHIIKFDRPIEQNCQDITLETFVDEGSGIFSATNTGNVPIYKIKLKTTSSGSSDVSEIKKDTGSVLPVGGSYVFTDYIYSNYEKVTIIPILLGKDNNGNVKEKMCDNTEFLI